MKSERVDWYGYNHEAVNKRFEGGLTFCNSFTVKDEYKPVSVYKVKNPNRDKGHKDYLLLQTGGDKTLVRGMDKDEMEKWRYQTALHCLECDTVVFSVNRHDDRPCFCGKHHIDGGRVYTKVSYNTSDKVAHELLTWDLIENREASRLK